MGQIILERFCYSDAVTLGNMRLDGGQEICTLERPWLDGMPGGVSRESCVPDGEYELVPHTRQNGDEVFALRNPDCHVYYTEDERGDKPGRFLILIHSANWVSQIVGCIAPGMSRNKLMSDAAKVNSSRIAVGHIMAAKPESILIQAAEAKQ